MFLWKRFVIFGFMEDIRVIDKRTGEVVDTTDLTIRQLSNKENYEFLRCAYVEDKGGRMMFEGDVVHIDGDRVWELRWGAFGDPHKLYAVDNINSCREIVYDIDELLRISKSGEYVPIAFFDITGNIRIEF